jgi:hypothetical protein
MQNIRYTAKRKGQYLQKGPSTLSAQEAQGLDTGRHGGKREGTEAEMMSSGAALKDLTLMNSEEFFK